MRDADRAVLEFAAAHHLILAEQVGGLLGIDPAAATHQLARLQHAGLIRRTRLLATHPACYQITSAGLAATGSELPPPRLNPTRYRHDIGAGWIRLMATKGNFGPLEHVLSEREMRAHDTKPNAANIADGPPTATPTPTQPTRPLCFGVRPRGPDAPLPTGLHYPDALLITSTGRVPIELQLTRPAAETLSAIMSGYAAQPNIRSVLYMIDEQDIARTIETTANRLGISKLIHLQRISLRTVDLA
jgi:hypothetical protein